MSVAAGFMVPHPPMIVPAVGKGSESQVQKTTESYMAVARAIADIAPDTIVISSPHAPMYADYFTISPGERARGSFVRFGAPSVNFDERYDEDFVYELSKLSDENDFPAGTLGIRDGELDHGVMVPLYFIRQVYTDYRLVRVSLSGLPLTEHYRLGQYIQKVSESLGRRTVFVASGDLSHKLQSYGPYGFAKEGPEYDERIMDVCGRGAFGELFDFDEVFCDKAAECGHRSFVIMAGAFDGRSVESRALSHEDVTGVGYGICTFYPGGRDEERRFLQKYLDRARKEIKDMSEISDPFVRLARSTVESYVRYGVTPEVPSGLPSSMTEERAGAFVSIHEHGRLRGCIGTILPTRKNLALEIIHNAVSASTADPRFSPIRKDELDYLEINVDVLGEPEDIESEAELDVKRYGVIVSCGARRGLLLPDLEGVDTVEQQIDIARQKGGIAPGEKIRLQRFEVIRHV